MKVKLFFYSQSKDIEVKINEWLKDNKNIKLLCIRQSEVQKTEIAEWDLTISIWYKELKK
jgi:hypothetical protein